MEVSFAPAFLRALKSLAPALQEEAIERIEAFKDPMNHKALKVHKLHGRMNGFFSFSVDYSTRVVFEYSVTKPRRAILLAIGDHDVYGH